MNTKKENGSKKFLFFIGLSMILIGGVIPSLPNSWISGLPNWIKIVSIISGIGIIILNLIWFFQDIDELINKKRKKN